MGRQYFNDLPGFTTAGASAISNTTTETALFTAPQLPINYFEVGKQLRLKVMGQYSVTGTPNMTFKVRMGNNNTNADTIMCSTAAVAAPTSGASTQLFELEALMQCQTLGTSGANMTNGHVQIYGTATTGTRAALAGTAGVTPATATVNTTITQNINVYFTWGTASASNTITALQMTLEALN